MEFNLSAFQHKHAGLLPGLSRVGTMLIVAAMLTACEQATDNEEDGVTQIAVVPATVSVEVGADVQVNATPKNADGDAVSGATVTWNSENTSVATVTNGLVHGVAAGITVVHAVSGSVNVPIPVTVTSGTVPSGSEFAIANTTSEESFGGVAYDGSNYLVAVQSHSSGGVSNVGAQRVSGAGALIGSPIVVPGRVGDPARVAFDGTNYLLVWADHTGPGSNMPILGQFVSTSGALVGSAFSIGDATTTEGGVVGLAFGGGTYFVAYVRKTNLSGGPSFTIYGRLVSPSGALGTELTLNATTREGFNAVAFDGTRFFTVYADNVSVRGRFVSTSGTLSSEVTIYTAPSGQEVEATVSAGFNGANYLVTFARHATASPAANDGYAQLVSPAGANVGSLITIANDAASTELPVGVVATGTNFLVSYLDKLSTPGELRIRGQFVSGAGATLGTPITLAAPALGKLPIGGAFTYNAGKYFVLMDRGLPASADPTDIELWTQKDVYGALLTIAAP